MSFRSRISNTLAARTSSVILIALRKLMGYVFCSQSSAFRAEMMRRTSCSSVDRSANTTTTTLLSRAPE